jgi:lipocalin-like protein
MNAVTDAQRFVGVWELEGIEEGDSFEGEKREFVSGFERPAGLLIYLASGFMSVNFAGSSRPAFLREFSPTLSELAAAGTAYGGYAGRWEVVQNRREVLHHVETAFIPNRVGRTIRRSYAFEEDSRILVLRPIALAPGEAAPKRILRWRRKA